MANIYKITRTSSLANGEPHNSVEFFANGNDENEAFAAYCKHSGDSAEQLSRSTWTETVKPSELDSMFLTTGPTRRTYTVARITVIGA